MRDDNGVMFSAPTSIHRADTAPDSANAAAQEAISRAAYRRMRATARQFERDYVFQDLVWRTLLWSIGSLIAAIAVYGYAAHEFKAWMLTQPITSHAYGALAVVSAGLVIIPAAVVAASVIWNWHRANGIPRKSLWASFRLLAGTTFVLTLLLGYFIAASVGKPRGAAMQTLSHWYCDDDLAQRRANRFTHLITGEAQPSR